MPQISDPYDNSYSFKASGCLVTFADDKDYILIERGSYSNIAISMKGGKVVVQVCDSDDLEDTPDVVVVSGHTIDNQRSHEVSVRELHS